MRFRVALLGTVLIAWVPAAAMADDEDSPLSGSVTIEESYSDSSTSEPEPSYPLGDSGGYDSQGRTTSTITFPGEGGSDDSGDDGGVRSAQ
jgi:hypothetical protein